MGSDRRASGALSMCVPQSVRYSKAPATVTAAPHRYNADMQSFFDALRVHPEPYTYLDERSVHETLTADPAGYIDHLDRSLTAIAAGDVTVDQPSKLVFEDSAHAGDFRVMPCV